VSALDDVMVERIGVPEPEFPSFSEIKSWVQVLG